MAETTIVSFILRFTVEEGLDPLSSTPAWRGMLRHVHTDEQINFVRLEEALEFIARYVDLRPSNSVQPTEPAEPSILPRR